MSNDWSRRKLLLAGLGTTLLAGCIGGSDSEPIRDSDGDGMIDSKDYAPNDPSVQLKSDVTSGTPTPRPTPTNTVEPTSTPTATPEPTVPSNTITVTSPNGEFYSSGFNSYSLQKVTLRHYGDIVDGNYPGDVNGLVFIQTYPDELTGDEGDVIWTNRSQAAFDPYEDATVDVNIDIPADEIPDEPFYMWGAIVRSDRTLEEIGSEDGEKIGETDRLRVEDGRLVRDPPTPILEDIVTQRYERTNAEGGYNLQYYGETLGKSWTVSLVVYKSAYFAASRSPRRTYDYGSYVSRAISNGYASAVGAILMSEAEYAGFTSKREQTELVIEFVQLLPYASDDVTTGFDEYPKTVVETIVEGGGDCEDTAILTAALLQAEPFGYDTILISPPGHMAVGIYGEDLLGTYWELDGRRYYYLETTGEGYDVGDIPDVYKDESARLYRV
jgi:hypothetical protein